MALVQATVARLAVPPCLLARALLIVDVVAMRWCTLEAPQLVVLSTSLPVLAVVMMEAASVSLQVLVNQVEL